MNTCLDTNVLNALPRNEQGASLIAVQLNAARPRGPLVIHVGVFAELLAAPDMTREHLEAFLQETGVRVDPEPPLWPAATLDQPDRRPHHEGRSFPHADGQRSSGRLQRRREHSRRLLLPWVLHVAAIRWPTPC